MNAQLGLGCRGVLIGAMTAIIALAPALHAPAANAQPTSPPGQLQSGDIELGDPTWEQYAQAFAALARGDRAAAIAQLQGLVAQFPNHPAAAKAQARLAELAKSGAAKATSRAGGVASEPKSSYARGELALWMTVQGIYLGYNVCESLDCSGRRPWVGSLMLGGAGGLAGALHFTRDGISDAESYVVSAGALWGAWNGIGLNDGFADTVSEAAISTAAQLGGIAGAIVLNDVWAPTEGQAALANTVGYWSLILSLWFYLSIDRDPELLELTLLSDVGLLAGVALAQSYPMSRGRTRLLDVGGILGLLIGGVGAAVANTSEGSGRWLLAGSTAGLALAWAMTSDWDAPNLPGNNNTLTLIPSQTGKGFIAGLSGTWE